MSNEQVKTYTVTVAAAVLMAPAVFAAVLMMVVVLIAALAAYAVVYGGKWAAILVGGVILATAVSVAAAATVFYLFVFDNEFRGEFYKMRKKWKRIHVATPCLTQETPPVVVNYREINETPTVEVVAPAPEVVETPTVEVVAPDAAPTEVTPTVVEEGLHVQKITGKKVLKKSYKPATTEDIESGVPLFKKCGRNWKPVSTITV